MTSLRAGLSGCSPASLELLRHAARQSSCAVVALHDDDPAARARAGAATGIHVATARFDELLATGVDFVVLAGPLDVRLAQVRAAAEQGAHCLVVAPFAADLATAAAMVEACAKAQVRLGCYTPEFQDPVIEQLRRMIAADWLGGPVVVQGIAGDDLALHDGPAPAHPFVDLVSRHIHLTTWLTGRRAVRVTALTTRTFGPRDDGGVATALLRGGIACSFTASHVTVARAFAVHGTDGGFRLAGDRLWLQGRREFRGEVFDYLTPGREAVLSREELAPEIAAKAGGNELLGRFARWLDDCDDFPLPGEVALDDLLVVDAMQRAAGSGHSEDVQAPRA